VNKKMTKSVCVLGATGTVGREYLRLLSHHPFFKIKCVTGRTSVGKKLIEALSDGYEVQDLPKEVLELEVQPTDVKKVDADLVFSPLPNEIALKTEEEFAKAGFKVITDASPHRMDSDVPLIIPEVNPEQLSLIESQKKRWSGFIVATPNCTAVGIAMTLKPLESFGVKSVVATTMQAVSGAGYPGVSSLDIIDNIIPFIQNEEEKVATETNKILGRMSDPIKFSVTTTRVPVLNGHTASLYVELEKPFEIEEIVRSLENFRGRPQELNLPTAPKRPIIVHKEVTRPQPRLDRDEGSVPGMSVCVGRVRRGAHPNSVQYVEVSNNTVRGGAGGAVLTAELLVEEGFV
jgi:aspartate-semialdehyde dehydrogenase (non-peptidoglycan organisms)